MNATCFIENFPLNFNTDDLKTCLNDWAEFELKIDRPVISFERKKYPDANKTDTCILLVKIENIRHLNVLNESPFVFDGIPYTISFEVKNLDSIFKKRDLFVFEISETKIQVLMSDLTLKEDFSKKLREKFNSRLLILPNLFKINEDKSLSNYNDYNLWLNDLCNFISLFTQNNYAEYCLFEKSFEENIWKEILNYIGCENFENVDKNIENSASQIKILGSKNFVEKAKSKITNELDVLKKKQIEIKKKEDQGSETINYLSESDFSVIIMSDLIVNDFNNNNSTNDLKISIDKQKREIRLDGNKLSISNFMNKLNIYVRNIKKSEHTFDKDAIIFILKNKQWIEQLVKDNKMKCFFQIVKKNENPNEKTRLEISSLNEENIKDCYDYLDKNFIKITYPQSEEKMKTVDQEKLKDFTQKEKKDKIFIKIESDTVFCVGKADLVKNFEKNLIEFFKQNSIETKTISKYKDRDLKFFKFVVNDQLSKLIDENEKNLKINNSFEILISDNSCLKIRANQEYHSKFNNLLDNLLKSRVEDELKFDSIELIGLFKEQHTLDTLKRIEKEQKCIIDTNTENNWHKKTVNQAAKEKNIEKNSKIKIKYGTLTDNNFVVDAVVNSTNTKLDLKSGQISSEILKLSGDTIQNELKTKYPNGIQLNEIAISSSGNMSNKKMIFHTIIENWKSIDEDKLKDQLKKNIYEILKLTDQHKLKTIGFPSLGTGSLNYPKSLIPFLMYESINGYFEKNQNSSIESVFIVVFDKDNDSVKEFKKLENSFEKDDKNLSLINNPNNSPKQINRLAQNNDHKDFLICIKNFTNDNKTASFQYKNTKFQVYIGDITQSTNDSIFNPTNSLLQPGQVSKALLEKDSNLQNEWLNLRKNFNGVAGCKATPGKLNCKIILNVDVKLKDYIEKTFSELERLNYTSITLPFVGTGINNGNPDECSTEQFESIIAYLEKNQSKTKINRIDICIYNRQDLFDKYISIIQNYKNPSKPKTNYLNFIAAPFVKLKKMVSNDANGANHANNVNDDDDDDETFNKINEQMNTNSYKEVILTIISNDKSKINNIKTEIIDSTKKEITEYDFVNELNNEITKDQKNRIDEFCKQNYVKTVWSNDQKCKLKGFSKKIITCVSFIHSILNENMLVAKCKWQYFENENWIDFSVYLNKEFEKFFMIYSKDKSKEEFFFKNENDENCVGNFKNLNFYEKINKKNKKKIRRIDVEKNPIPPWIPPNWDLNKEEDLIQLDPNSLEYKNVEKIYLTNGLSAHLKKIASIQRVQNYALYNQYVIFRDQLKKKNPNNKNVEKIVFHGTSATSIENIWKTGFNRGYCGKNAVMYGQGVYFAKQSSYSHNYTDINNNNKRTMFLCKIAVGKIEIGNSSMKVPPNDADTTVDNLSDPNIFVVYKDPQAYPEYLLTYE